MIPVLPLNSTTEKPNWPLLAAIRFGLALAIVVMHLSKVAPANPLVNVGLQFNGLAVVTAFLFISGFSISHSIHTRPKGFLKRRLERIYPIFFVCVLISILPFALFGAHLQMPTSSALAPSLFQFLSSVAMLQNTLALPISTFNPSWSLALECAFYLCAPWLARKGEKWIVPLCVSSAVFFALQPFGILPGCDFYYADMLAMTPAIFLAWAWLGGWCLERHRDSKPLRFVAFLAPVLFACNPHDPGRLGVLVIAATIASLIYGPHLRLSSALQKIFSYLGDLSYPLYMCHYPLMYLLYQVTKSTSPLPYLLTSLTAATLIFHFVDLPCRAFSKSPKVAPTDLDISPYQLIPHLNKRAARVALVVEKTSRKLQHSNPLPLDESPKRR